MSARLSALIVWALVVASAVAWGLHLFARGPVAPSNTVTVGDSIVSGGDLTRLLGAAPVVVATAAPVPAMASRFQLTGVVAPKPPATQGIALIAVDGKVPRAFLVGARIDGDLSLQSVDRRTASIGNAGGAAAVVLEMPPLPVAATGVLSAARGDPPVNTFPQPAPSYAVPVSPTTGGSARPQIQPQPQTQFQQYRPQQQPQSQPVQPQIQLGLQPGLDISNPPPGGEPPHTLTPDRVRRLPGTVD